MRFPEALTSVVLRLPENPVIEAFRLLETLIRFRLTVPELVIRSVLRFPEKPVIEAFILPDTLIKAAFA